MIGMQITCAREGCDNVTEKTTHNQKYCTRDCTRIATNAKMMERYHENTAIAKGKVRMCKVCETTKLSRYNLTNTCAPCERKARETNHDALSALVGSVSWG